MDARNGLSGNLPLDIEVRRGELRIRFVSAAGLAAKLFELSQLMANDWDAFSKGLESIPD